MMKLFYTLNLLAQWGLRGEGGKKGIFRKLWSFFMIFLKLDEYGHFWTLRKEKFVA